MSHYQTPCSHAAAYQEPSQSTGTRREKEGSGYLRMLNNMANDLDQLLTDIGHKHPFSSDQTEDQPTDVTAISLAQHHGGDTLGKDSFLSGSGPLSSGSASRRLGNNNGSIQSLLSSSSDNNLSVDSGHDERTHGTTSPLAFDPHHLAYSLKTLDTTSKGTMTSPLPPGIVCPDNGSHSSEDLRPISLVERLATTHSIWLLSQMSRAGAVHLLKDRATGVFIIRKSSQAKSLAMSVQNRLKDRANVDHYLIESTDFGMRLQGSAHVFPSIPTLLAHYMEHLDELPYRLTLPEAILQAKSSRELSSLALLGQDFWLSLMSRRTGSSSPIAGVLHKSCSEPLNIRHPLYAHDTRCASPLNTLPLHPGASYSDVPHSREQQQMFTDQLSAQMMASSHNSYNARRLFVSPTVEPISNANMKLGPHVLRLQGSNDTLTSTDSSGEEGGISNRPHLQLLGTSPRSYTTLGANSGVDLTCLKDHLPQGKPNLYSLAPLEMYHPPDNSYFRSSLSDKMSDYEDIWRSSYYDSDSIRNGSIRGDDYDIGSAVTARSEFSKFFAIGGNKTNSAVKPVTVMVSVDSESHHVTDRGTPSSGSNMKVNNVNPKLLSPFGRMSRLKSSSESSLATVASPVYAEPVDAVVFRKHPNKSSHNRLRRQSAPSIPSEVLASEIIQQARRSDMCAGLTDCPGFPSDSGDHPDYAQPKKLNIKPKVESSVDPEPVGKSDEVSSNNPSLLIPQNVPHYATTKSDRQERLKLGAKAPNQDRYSYTAGSKRVEPQFDDSLFAVKGDATSTASCHKFPVYQHSKVSRSLHRESCYTESTTIQDIIARVMPEMTVRPIQSPHTLGQPAKPLSEYDNFNPYAPPSASSLGTVFCKPWEGGMADTLIRSSKNRLPPAMNLLERVQKWQEANQTFHQLYHYERLQQDQHKADRENSGQENAAKQINSAHGVPEHVDSVPKTNIVDKRMDSVETDQGITMPKTRRHLNASPHRSVSPSNPRPQSMYHQSLGQRPVKKSGTKLTRSLSQPDRSARHLSVASKQQQHESSGQQKHHQQTSHQQGLQVAIAPSSVFAAEDKAGLSSNCPDVINCHHVGLDTRNTTLSEYKLLFHSVHSTPQSSVRVPQYTQHIGSPGGKIKEYIHKLSRDQSTIFGGSIENFIQCTLECQDRNPHHVMSNVRQFMTGIKNYLVKHGEGQLEALIETERSKLGTNEILNIDGLIETTLHVCVLRPLQQHIYSLLVDFHGRNNSLELISRNIRYARMKTPEEIGIKPGLIPPHSADIKGYLDAMQRAFSPLEKLENLLKVTSAICTSAKIQGKQVPVRGPGSLGADDFLPLLIYVLVHYGLVSAEIEADYMWGLLHPSVLTGEGGYYLTTLSSAVLLLKNFQKAHESKAPSLEGQLPTIGEVQGFLKIAFPDELRDTIVWKTLPVRPNMTAKDVCAMIAHKFKFTNPQDYGLVLLCDGEESQLEDAQCPQILKRDKLAAGRHFFFAYKRLDANIAWPSSVQQS